MKTHPEPGQLSAFLDGEVEAAERAQIDKHVRGCAECSATLNALRATVAEMHELPSPVPSEQDSWALRSALSRERARPAKRYQRWVVAAGSVAAVAIAIVVITQTGESPKQTAGPTEAQALAGGGAAGLVTVEDTNFDQKSASALLTTAFTENRSAALPGTKDTASGGTVGSPVPGSSGAFAAPLSAAGPDVASYVPKIQGCEQELFGSDTAAREPLRYIVARYKGTPAFFLLYNVTAEGTTKTELWVVQQKDCFIRLYLPPR